MAERCEVRLRRISPIAVRLGGDPLSDHVTDVQLWWRDYSSAPWRTLEMLTCPLKSGPDLMLGSAVLEEADDGEAASHGGADYRQAARG